MAATNIVVHNVEQRTPEWHALRAKYPLTASNAYPIATNGKGLETLVWEAITRKYALTHKEALTNEHLERGVALESTARMYYEASTFNPVQEVGFVTNSAVSSVAGASPDGLVGADGLVEIKCPDDTKFFKLFYEQTKLRPVSVETPYAWQMQMQMLITERAWCDYVVYNENFTVPLLIQRVYADKDMHAKLVAGLMKGQALLEEIEHNLTN